MGSVPALGLLLLLVLGRGADGLHSLRYFYVAVSEPSPGLPQFTAVGYVDGILISQYSSNTGRVVPRVKWMEDNMDPEYWEGQTQIERSNEQIGLMNLDTLRSRYNQSGRAHTLQVMSGCDLLEDESTRGYWQYAYDGRDFIAFDMDTMTFTAADAAALVTKRKWEEDGTVAERMKHYLESTCIEWLKKYVSHGQEMLERKEPPTVRVSGQEAHGVLSLRCRAYGFYPRPISVSWLKDGEVRDQDTEWGGVAPNSDGTYYTWASIEARPEDRDKYRCRVEHAGLPEPGLYAWEPDSNPLPIVLGVAGALVVAIAAIAGVLLYTRMSGNPEGYKAPPSKA
ncbi:class I histocompatibility antigen, F10 alpha chain-like [Colius striatus]|uniref:class I histocompatibility antigen, F10 alpha chain-like n=1 Tax=Colius striatus TaxID=57412 RepID=UPI002B1E0C7C|nr:class I histocompatibility antigen, F10 alpha chain-like [Colius striatus]